MYDYLKLIIFNIIIIFLSFTFKKHIIIFYPFLLLFMLSYETTLKNKLVEGNIQDDLYKSLSNFKEKEEKMDLPLGKIEKILEKMLEKFSGTKMTDDNKCQGEFYINKLTNKECGEGFNERLYKIIDEGDGNCLHSELYKEKVPLPSCKFNEECESDLDCESNNCSEGRCIDKLDCNENMLSGCNRRSCLALNSGLDRDIYYYQNNECKVDPCNEQNYRMCDESGCNSLSYRYRFNDTRGICEQIVQEVDNTGLTTGSYMSLISGFGDKGCNKNNPEDCSGVCSEFDPDTTENCTIGGTIDNPEPNYICKTPSDDNYYYNIDVRDTGNIYDNTNRFPCRIYNYNDNTVTLNFTLSGVVLDDINSEEMDILKTRICNIIHDSQENLFDDDDCMDNIELSDGSNKISIKNITIDKAQDDDLTSIINKDNLINNDDENIDGINLNNILSTITSIESGISIELPDCPDNKVFDGGCTTCEPGKVADSVSSSCKYCPSRQIPNSDSTGCVPCPDGQKPNNKRTNCEYCPDDHYLHIDTRTGTPVARCWWKSRCAAGQRKNYEQDSDKYTTNGDCTPCDPGSISQPGYSSECQSCSDAGIYTSEEGEEVRGPYCRTTPCWTIHNKCMEPPSRPGYRVTGNRLECTIGYEPRRMRSYSESAQLYAIKDATLCGQFGCHCHKCDATEWSDGGLESCQSVPEHAVIDDDQGGWTCQSNYVPDPSDSNKCVWGRKER